jgi:hypothetical protein
MKISKTTLTALVAGIAIGSTGVGAAAVTLLPVDNTGALMLKQDQAVTYGNVHCLAANPVKTVFAQFVCVRNDGKGVATIVRQTRIIVVKATFDKRGKPIGKPKIYLNRPNP